MPQHVPSGAAAGTVASAGIWSRDFALVWLCRFCIFFTLTMLIPTLPLYLTSLRLTPTQVGVVVSTFFLSATVIRPLAGYFVDRHGARKALLVSLVPYALGAGGHALVSSIPLLVLMRAIQGVGFSVTSATHALVVDLVPRERRGEALGSYSISSNVASAFAATLGVWIYYRWGAQPLFLSAAIFACLAWVLIRMVPHRADWDPRPAPSTASYFRTFFTRDTLVITIPLFAITFATGGVNTFLPIQAQSRGVANPGLYFTAFALTLVVMRPLMGRLSDRFSRHLVLVPAYIPMVAAFVLLGWLPTPGLFYVAAVLHGIGYGTMQSTLMASLVDRVPAERRGAAMAQWSLFYDSGIGGAGFVLGFVLDATGQSYAWMYGACIALMLVTLVFYVESIRRESRRPLVAQASSPPGFR